MELSSDELEWIQTGGYYNSKTGLGCSTGQGQTPVLSKGSILFEIYFKDILAYKLEQEGLDFWVTKAFFGFEFSHFYI